MTGAAGPALRSVLGDETGRTFDAPWQAQAFALVAQLSKTGHFGWDEWVRMFSQEIARSPSRAGESENDTYYRQWLDALEQIVVEKGLLAPGDAQERASAWSAAYANTPHGQPVDLAHATCPPAHTHRMNPRRVPITISPAVPRAALPLVPARIGTGK
jgi:nitrile hydratase accessory protein